MAIRLPMFPLGNVIFPYSAVPLRVFEPRYLTLLDSVSEGSGEFGSVLIERGFEVGGGDQRFAIGTSVRIVGSSDLEDGRPLSMLRIRKNDRSRDVLEAAEVLMGRIERYVTQEGSR